MNKYYYETPLWAVVILSSVSIAFSVFAFIAFLNYDSSASGSPRMMKWLFLGMSLVFLAAGLKPRNWKPWRYFYADRLGLHFPTECPETKNTEWLLVSWDRVGEIDKELFANRSKGPAIEIKISDRELEQYFRTLKLSKVFFDQSIKENGYFKVGYSNVFKNTDEAVSILCEFKRRYA